MPEEAWCPEDEPPGREEALAYERFLKVILREEGGKVPEALARRYLNLMLDPEFAKRQPRTHAKMLERFHSMMQKDRHLAAKLGWLDEAKKVKEKPWQIHIHRHDDAAGAGATLGPVVDPSLSKNQGAPEDGAEGEDVSVDEGDA